MKKCLDSIVCQVENDVELVLVDDGSPDGCGIIADEYADKYSFVKAYHKTNGGLSDARNFGINHSKGEYMWFIDSDDYIEPDSVRQIVKCLIEIHPDTMVIQSKMDKNSLISNERNYTIKPGVYNSHDYMEQLRIHPEASIFCAQYEIVNRKFVLDNNLLFYKGILHEDELWTPQVLISASSIYYSDLNIYYHVMRDGSIMNSNNHEKSGRSDIIITQELFDVFEKSGRNDLTYMRDHAVDTFMQSIWKIPNFLETENICRTLPFRNAYYKKTKIKAFLYFLSPHLYLKLHNRLK